MSRPLRVEYPGAVYHVMARGHERGRIFEDDADRERFLEEVARVVVEQRWRVHAYCLMTNHYHLLVETQEANLSTGMHLLNGRHGQSHNFHRKRKGHLFEDRYKAIVVEKESYLLELGRYVVLNPVRAGMVRSAREYRWSNYRATSGEIGKPAFLTVDWTLEQLGNDIGKAREAYRRFVAEGKGAGSPMDDVTGQVFLGGPEFLLEMKRRIGLGKENGDKRELSRAIPRAQREVGFVDLEMVVAAVAEEYGVGEEELVSRWRRGEEKAVAVYLGRRMTGESGVTLGRRFGITSARVGQLARKIEDEEETKLKGRVARIEERLRGKLEWDSAKS